MYAWLHQPLRLGEPAEVEAALTKPPPPGQGLTVVPFLAGERSPGWAGSVPASLHGLTLATTPIDILRASLAAVAYRFARIERRICGCTDCAHRLIAGGGALLRSPAWMQIVADMAEPNACAEYVRYDPVAQRFDLPVEHRPVQAGEGAPEFLGGLYQGLQSIEQGHFGTLIRAFRQGGSIQFGRNQVVQQTEDGRWQDSSFVFRPEQCDSMHSVLLEHLHESVFLLSNELRRICQFLGNSSHFIICELERLHSLKR